MPWTDYSPDVRQFSGLVQGAAQARFGAAATAEVVSLAARAAGIRLGFSAFTDIARMYGSYVGVRSAGETLAAAAEVTARTGIAQGITGAMIGAAPYSPGVAQWNLNPYVLVKASYSLETPEGPITSTFSHRYNLNELHTVGQVLADMQAQLDIATSFGSLQGGTVSEISSIERANP